MKTPPEEIALDALIEALKEAFAEEKFPVDDDNLHPSLGKDRTVIGVSPGRSRFEPGQALVQETEFTVQFFGKYDLKVDPFQKVSSKPIIRYAERFREAMKDADPHLPGVWYFMVQEIRYPSDPTGNKTRFEATVVARGNNYALHETE